MSDQDGPEYATDSWRTDSRAETLRALLSVSTEQSVLSGFAPSRFKKGFSDNLGSRALKLRMRRRPVKNTAAAACQAGTLGSSRLSCTLSSR